MHASDAYNPHEHFFCLETHSVLTVRYGCHIPCIRVSMMFMSDEGEKVVIRVR